MSRCSLAIPLDPHTLAAEEVPPELYLDYYISDLDSGPYREVLRGPFCWSPLEELEKFLRQPPWPLEVQQRLAPVLADPPLVVRCGGAIRGHVEQAEGVLIEPYVTIQAEGGLVYLDRGVRLHSFVRLEAGPHKTIYIGPDTVIGAGCHLQGDLYVGPGCRLIGADLRGLGQIGPATVVEHAVLEGPIIMGAECEIRPGAYLRGNCLLGDRVIFRSEAKNVILLDGVLDLHTAAGHYAYLGDSILGRRVNLGAGTKTANLRLDRGTVCVQVGGQRYTTGRRKFGAVLGDDVQTGCLTVCDPGTLVGPRTRIYPGAHLRGTYPPDSLVKVRQAQEIVAQQAHPPRRTT